LRNAVASPSILFTEALMRGSLRVHSLMGLAVLIGWSLLADARERVAPTRIGSAKVTPRPSVLANRTIPGDPKLWN
jgi:hypothetical protein